MLSNLTTRQVVMPFQALQELNRTAVDLIRASNRASSTKLRSLWFRVKNNNTPPDGAASLVRTVQVYLPKVYCLSFGSPGMNGSGRGYKPRPAGGGTFWDLLQNVSLQVQVLIYGLAVLLLWGIGISTAHAAAAKRIVSINLCADQFLLALADRKQILALSPSAHNSALSFYADKAKGIARIRDKTESVLTLKPDLVFASAYNKRQTINFLRRQGIPVFIIPPIGTFKDVREKILHVAKTIGQEARGINLAQKFDKTLEVTRSQETGNTRTALYYQRAGYVTGRESLIGALLNHLGLRNQAHKLGVRTVSYVPIERVIAFPPDLLVVSDWAERRDDQGGAMFSHPALVHALPLFKRIILPVRETVCPGPSLLFALERLAMKVRMAEECVTVQQHELRKCQSKFLKIQGSEAGLMTKFQPQHR